MNVLEIAHAIRKHRGVSVEEFDKKRTQKAQTRGRFDEGIILERVEE
jgi:predicted house-cleaning noncanonical NTP pyrophosphatase (MazG superfamily)